MTVFDKQQRLIESLTDENAVLRADLAVKVAAMKQARAELSYARGVTIGQVIQVKTLLSAALLHPTEEWEDVEVVMYGIIFEGDAVISVTFDTSEHAARRLAEIKSSGESARIIELKGVDRIRKTPKVKRRKEITSTPVKETLLARYPGCKFFREWEE